MKCSNGHYVSGDSCMICEEVLRIKEDTNIKSLDKKLVKLHSKYVRLRDAYKYSGGEIVKCITCENKGNYKHFHNGHFIPRGSLLTRFHDKNCNAQCENCNVYLDGNEKEYAIQIDLKYGKGTAEHLRSLSKKVSNWGAFEYQSMIKDYTQRIKDLENLIKNN